MNKFIDTNLTASLGSGWAVVDLKLNIEMIFTLNGYVAGSYIDLP
jgi:hypothetical protein